MCFLRRLLALLILCGPAVALAQSSTAPFVGLDPLEPVTVIDTVGTDAPRSTACMPTKGWKFIQLNHVVTRTTGTLSKVTTACVGHYTSDCSDTALQIPLCIDNVCSAYEPYWTVDASEGWPLSFNTAASHYVKCTLTFVNGAANDKIKVTRVRTRE